MDFLTSLWTRQDFFKNFDEIFSKNKRRVNIAICDIDKFKSINDTYGHNVGDIVIKKVANVLKENFEPVVRWGGEEFLIINFGEKAKFYEKLENLRKKVKQIQISELDRIITISTGFVNVEVFEAVVNFSKCVSYADKALYKAKRSGRDRIFDYNDLNTQLKAIKLKDGLFKIEDIFNELYVGLLYKSEDGEIFEIDIYNNKYYLVGKEIIPRREKIFFKFTFDDFLNFNVKEKRKVKYLVLKEEVPFLNLLFVDNKLYYYELDEDIKINFSNFILADNPVEIMIMNLLGKKGKFMKFYLHEFIEQVEKFKNYLDITKKKAILNYLFDLNDEYKLNLVIYFLYKMKEYKKVLELFKFLENSNFIINEVLKAVLDSMLLFGINDKYFLKIKKYILNKSILNEKVLFSYLTLLMINDIRDDEFIEYYKIKFLKIENLVNKNLYEDYFYKYENGLVSEEEKEEIRNLARLKLL